MNKKLLDKIGQLERRNTPIQSYTVTFGGDDPQLGKYHLHLNVDNAEAPKEEQSDHE